VAGCYLYREGVLEGIFTDVRGLFMEDFTAFLARRCAGIDIIEENGPEGEG
jgi:hypothetical protein